MNAGEAQRRMATLPFAGLDTILGGRDPLVLAPHPDDESLGCGGLLAECVSNGAHPHVLVLTDGTGSHPNSPTYPAARLSAVREQETLEAVRRLGLAPDQVGFLSLRDTAAPLQGASFDAAVDVILVAIQNRRCGVLVAPWRHDPHCDHLAAHFMAAAAARRAGIPHLAYPVWGWTLPPHVWLDGPVLAGWRLDIARHLPAKRLAIAAHASQHSDLIQDDPAGFRLPSALLARFDQPYEVFLTTP